MASGFDGFDGIFGRFDVAVMAWFCVGWRFGCQCFGEQRVLVGGRRELVLRDRDPLK